MAGAMAFKFGAGETSLANGEQEDAIKTEVAALTFERASAGLEAEAEGCMALDCGAAKTLGSAQALEKVVEAESRWDGRQ